jgi:hypothetical protein
MATQESLDLAQTLYVAYYGRPADRAGLNYWADEIDANGVDAMVNAFGNSAEFEARFGNLSNEQLINNLYQQMFGRSAELAGLDFYSAQLANGESTLAEIALDIANGAQNEDATALSNKVAVAANFTAAIDTTEEVLAYAGDSAANSARDFLATVNAETDAETVDVDAQLSSLVQADQDETTAGETFTLTANTDVVDGTGGDDTIVGAVDTSGPAANTTLNSSDVISGGDGTDKLQLTTVGTTAANSANFAADITDVENFFIRDVNTGGASDYDFANVVGEEQVWSDRSTQDVDFQNLGTDTVVGLKGNGSTQMGDVSFNMAAATDAVSIVADGGVRGTPNVTNTAAGATTASIASTGTANVLGTVTLANTGTITTFNVAAAADLTASLAAGAIANNATLNISGEGDVNLTDNGATFSTVAAGDATGDITIGANTANAKVTTGAGADQVTITAALASGASINLGAGDDALLAGAGAAIGTGVVVDGGAGSDTISASLINAANAANIQNFEALDLSANTATPLDVELLTASTIEALTLSGGAGTATVNNVAAGVGLLVEGSNTGTTTVGVKGAATGAADSFAITFDNDAIAGATATVSNVSAGTVVTNGVEAMSVDSSGGNNTWNDITITNDALQTLTIAGDKNLDVALAGTVGATATATNGFGVAEIDGSAATGDLNIDVTGAGALNLAWGGVAIKGGAGDDTITIDAQGAELTGGAGEDTFVVAAAVATGTTEATSVLTTITDLNAGDTIDFGAAVTAFESETITLGAGVNNLDQALAAAVDTASEATWFQYGDSTYIVADADASGAFSANDIVVKLTGLVDLSGASLTGGELTIA